MLREDQTKNNSGSRNMKKGNSENGAFKKTVLTKKNQQRDKSEQETFETRQSWKLQFLKGKIWKRTYEKGQCSTGQI